MKRTHDSFTAFFNTLSKRDTSIAGGKGASLGEMVKAGIVVPNGFVILTPAFDKFLRDSKIFPEINKLLLSVNIKNIESVQSTSKKIRNLILSKKIPSDISRDILQSFNKLKAKFVAVRSSATSEDSASDAWAGQLETYLNSTEKDLLTNVKKCWASLFTPRAIFYRFEKKLNQSKISVAVVVQKMINSERSGIAFSVHPVTQDRDQMIIEAGFGLGEAIVSGSITPDSYVVDKRKPSILNVRVSEQKKALFRKKEGGNEWRLLGKKGRSQVLTSKQIVALSKLIVQIENHYGFPVDVEWAQEKGKFYILQSRPITTIEQKRSKTSPQKIIEKFLSDTNPRNIYKLSFEFIPLFWTIPVFFLDKDLSAKFAPTLLVKHKEESYLFIDSNYVFGYAKKVLENYLSTDNTILQVVENKYKTEIGNIDNLYNKLLEDKKYSEKELNLLLRKNLRVFKDFFVACSLTYLDHDSIFDLIKKHSKISAKKIKKILEIDIHKPFKLIHEETILSFKKNKGKKNYKSLAYLFISYSKVPKESEIQDIVTKTSLSVLNESIQSVNQSLRFNLKKYEKLYVRLNAEEQRLVDFIQMIKYIREDRKQYFSKLFFSLYKVSEFLLRKWQIKGVENGYVFAFELLKGKEYVKRNRSEILKRKKGYIFYCDNESEPTLIPFSGDTKIELNNLENMISTTDSNLITGEATYKGKVFGKAVVAVKNKDFSKIKEGNVLVTSMTRPETLPYLKKVKAIITDEGGVTCHAAIISRELKKPCIVGSKVATSVIKDGDLVEVDADNGVVKILKKVGGK